MRSRYWPLLAVLVGIQAITLSGQCPINTVSTDPNNYSNAYDPNNERQWDWMAPTYQMYVVTGQPPITMNSPFYDINQRPNIDHLNDVAKPDGSPFLDFLPEDGWELLYRNFGSTTQAQFSPHFLLYNRYTGMIRAFVLVTNFNSVGQTATVTLSFKGDGSAYYQTALLNNFGNDTRTSEDYLFDAAPQAPNKYINPPPFVISDNWMYAEFSTIYDPCTCVLPEGKLTELKLNVDVFNQTKIELESFGTVTETIADNGVSNSDALGYSPTLKDIFSGGVGVYKDGKSGYKKGEDWANKVNDIYNDHHNFIGKMYYKLTQNDDQIFHDIVGQVSDILPYGGAIYYGVRSLVSLIKKFNSTASPQNLIQPTLKIQELKFKTTGTETTTIPVTDASFVLPGSPHSFGIGDNSKKVAYNNVLGVFGLLEAPVLEYTESQPYTVINGNEQSLNSDYWSDDICRYHSAFKFPYIHELRLKQPLKYVVNEASGLTIKDIRFCYVIESRAEIEIPEMGQKDLSQLYEERIYDEGYMVEFKSHPDSLKGAQISTPYLEPPCFEKWLMRIYQPYGASDAPNVNVRVKVILEPVNPASSSNVEEVLLVYTYPATVVPAAGYNSPANKYYVKGNFCTPGDLFNTPLYNYWWVSSLSSNAPAGSLSEISSDWVIENGTWSENLSVAHVVLVKNNGVIMSGQPINIKAGKEINITSAFGPTSIKSNSHLSIGIDNNCYGQPFGMTDKTEVNSFCEGKYLAHFNQSNRSFHTEGESHLADAGDVNIYPNPTNGRFTSELLGELSGLASVITIYDLTGRLVREWNVSENPVSLDLSDQPAGTYLVHIRAGESTIVKRVSIVH